MKGRNPLPGLVLLLCATLLVGCNSFSDLASRPAEDRAPATGPVETPVSESPATPITPPTSDSMAGAAPDDSTVDPGIDKTSLGDALDADELAPAGDEPEIGEITFALGATDNYEPIDPGILFTKGITQIHAIFDYSGMANRTWERVWYLNDKEISRSSDPWTGPASGVFDYYIDNGGKPLPAGDWILEIYVGGELRSLGVFIIEDSQE